MKHSRISYQIHAQNVPDTALLLKHLTKISPVSVMVMDGLALALQIKDMLPNTLVIHRNYGLTNGDEDVYKRVSPERWLELRAKESEDGKIWLLTTTEPAFDKDCIDWHLHLMELAVATQTPLIIGNWGVGIPGPDDWALAKDMLNFMALHPDLFILGLHEYFAAVPTSGFYGGYPDNAGVEPGKPGGQNLVPFAAWPHDTSSITLWHCGRFRFLVKYCEANGIKPPRIILTEHGMDDVSDIKPFLQTITADAPYHNIRGWKTAKTWLQQTYPMFTPERAYFEELKYLDDKVYKGSVVEGQLIFAWCGPQSEWEQFSVAQAGTFQQFMEQSVNGVDTTEAPAVPIAPPVIIPPPLPTIDPPLPPAPIIFPPGKYDTIISLLQQLLTEFERLNKAA